MCGIACILSPRGNLSSAVLESFTNAVAHRGPDGVGFMRFAAGLDVAPSALENCFLGLGHRRLSILDLSEAGAQPMASADGSLTVVYNGEIYNYLELRRELEATGEVFRSHCDTEVLLAAYRRWGRECLTRFNGMWSFVLLDKARRTLFISRDRLGVKPLYYCRTADGTLAFASEIKQFFTLPTFKKIPRAAACVGYLVNGYENPPETFFEGVMAFPPGCRAEVSLDEPKVAPERFWFPDNITLERRSEAEFAASIRRLFSDAVRFRLRSDVPVGGCLSGGLDSSSIFVEMKKLEPSRTFNAFSACFDSRAIDERPFMRLVVDATASDHHTVFPAAEGLAADFEGFLRSHDEPVGSLSMYAQYLIMKEARKAGVPVLLDGQGGDELFSGYWPSYMLCLNHHRRNGDYLFVAKQLLGALLPSGNQSLFSEAWTNFREYRRRAGRKLPFEILDRHLALVESSTWHVDAQSLPPAEYRKAEIFKVHLPRLLKWEDRNSMAHSIESRVPFLDVNLVELALSIPPEMNMRSGWNKYLLRKSMAASELPRAICWRKDKKGFETPQSSWMRTGPFHAKLLEWAGKSEHPASEYVSTSFGQLHTALVSGDFEPWPLFRLFCLDEWLRLV